jgi:iron-sulfur cluster repair protein YtfE (RIC family)
MSTLIEEFKKEHSEIIEAFKEVKELDVLTKEGHSKLMYLLSDLLKHLWHEDEQLYPVLRKASEHNKKLKEILSSFINGLGVIHEEVLQFMTKYYKGDLSSNFHKEYERLFDDLSKRIGYEENILYGEYEELNKL